MLLKRLGFTNVPRTLALVRSSAPGMAVALAFLAMLSAGLPLAIAWIGKSIIDAVVAHDADLALRRTLIELIAVAAQAALMRASGLGWQQLGARLGVDVNVAILEKARTLDLRHFEDASFYDKLTRARREASSRPVSLVTRTFGLAQNALSVLITAGALLSYSPLAVAGLLLAAIPAAVAEMRYSNAAFRLRNWRSPDTRRLAYLEYVLSNDEHAKEVALFGLGPLLLGRYKALAERFYTEDTQLAVRRSGAAYALSLLATGSFYAVYASMAVAAATGKVGLGELTFYVAAFRQGQSAFQGLLGAIGGMYEDDLYMANLFEYLEIPTGSSFSQDRPEALVHGPSTGTGTGLGEQGKEAGLRFDSVGFKYPGAEGWALRNVDLFVPKGQSLALVGHNGAGKTTFIKLMTRLYEPTEGRILLDGRDLRAWDPADLRARIGVIFQDFAQYQLTVGENVGFGSVENLGDAPRIERAVERGGAESVVTGLKKGLDTPLGRWFNEGVELSGGQWQKIALSRAFVREEADILVLDEPTAALDADAEHAVFQRFRELARTRTTIVVSHRFPTVRMADRIVVLDGGTVVESGTHAELVAMEGRYARMFQLQAEGYR